MDSEEDYSQDYGSDWSEEDQAADCMDDDDHGESNDLQDSAAVDRRRTYKILTEEDIKRLQENDIATVSGVLSVPRGVACALLCRNNWSLTSVYEHWFAAAADNAGESNPEESVTHICKICYEITGPREAVSAACGHPFCADCLKSYIAAAVSGGAGCLTLECPEPSCEAAVTSDMVEELASEADVSRYLQYLRCSYVESSRNRKWCPAAGCDRAVELEAAGNDSYDYDVVCGCLTAFCWRCSGERHDPLGCAAAAEWAESARWILAHTKPCPNCRRPIQKSEGGCDHMVCAAPCRFEFCWACSVPWIRGNDHCRRCAEERERKAKERQERLIMKEFKAQPNSSSSSNETTTKAKAKRKRFTGGNCYERWVFNEKTRKRAMADLEEAKKKYTGEGRGGMQFVVEAWEQIVECWNVLNWSYVYVYSLPETMGKRAVLEHFQAVAEAALEQLQCYAEEGILDGDKGVFRIKLVDLTKVASHRFESLVLAMKNEVEGFAPYWEKEALELKNDIAIAETIALDMEKEALEEKNHIAIALSYALDLHDLEMAEEDSDLKKDLGEVEVESCSLDSDKALDLKNEVGSCVFNLEKDAIDLKNNLAEAGSRVFKLEKETLDLKNNIAEVERHALDLEKDSLNLKNDLAEVESCALELEKKAVDLKNELAEVGSSDLDLKNDKAEIESYVLVSEVKKNDIAYDDDDEYVLVSEEEEEEAQDSKKTQFT